MIKGSKIVSISGERGEGEIENMHMDIKITDLKGEGNNLEISFEFNASFGKGGKMSISGVLFAEEDESLVNSALDMWKNSKKIPSNYASTVLTTINYVAGGNGALLAKVLNLPFPITPPRVRINE